MTADPIAFLFSLERLGIKFGLENMTRLCAALDHPEGRFRSVIVAGTNGKGSVTAMVEAAVRAAGHRSARYTSPHLERFEERFVIDGVEAERGELARAAGRVQHAVEGMLERRELDAPPTFFECTTAVAFELFSAARVDLAVLEVGLGGRLDATNVVSPLVAAVTSVDLDHQALLGTTLESIAREKAGVIKHGVPVVAGPLAPPALQVVHEVSVARGAPLFQTAEYVVASHTEGEQTFADFDTGVHRFENVRLALRGRHQADNAAVALGILEQLDAAGVAIDEGSMRAGLERATWPGRLEVLSCAETRIVLDAAHNPAGARALAAFLEEAAWSDATLVFGALRDKDAAGMLDALAPRFHRIIFTTPVSPRALPAEEAARIAAARGLGRAGPEGERETTPAIEIVPDPAAALARARATSRRVVVAGSIFLIGPLRGILR